MGNREMGKVVSPWVNLCYVVEGWIDGWMNGLTAAWM